MNVGFVLTIMVLTTEEKVFNVEHYFRSYEVGAQNGLSLCHVREHYEEQFNKTAPSNKTILAIVEKFHSIESVLCQWKGTTGHLRNVTTNENHERPLQQVLQSTKHSLLFCKVSVSRHGILGPYFIKEDAQNPLTLNQECYREIIIAPFVWDLKRFCLTRNLPLRRQWMQQDGATAYTMGESLACLQHLVIT